MTGVFIWERKGKERKVWTLKHGSHVTVVSEIGVMQSQGKNTKNCQRPPEAREEGWEGFFLRAWILDFWLLET